MNKKKKSSETTGPIRVVLFKGTQKPTTKQITEKHMIALYTIIGFLIFLLLFLTTTLLIVSSEKSSAKTKYSQAENEIIRLKKMIRNISGYDGSDEQETDVSPQESENKNTKPASVNTNGASNSPANIETQPQIKDSSGEPKEENGYDLNIQEKNLNSGGTPGQSSEMKAEISGFKGNFIEESDTFNFRYWIANLNDGTSQLEGKAVVIIKTGDNLYTYPRVSVENGNAVIGKSGTLFRILHRKEMTGQIRIPAAATDIKEAIIVLTDLNGNEITRSVFTINN